MFLTLPSVLDLNVNLQCSYVFYSKKWLLQFTSKLLYLDFKPCHIPLKSLVKHMVKKNRSCFPIVVLLITLICSHQTNANLYFWSTN